MSDLSLHSAPTEYLVGRYFERVRRRFELCGVREEPDGSVLVLKCRTCNYDLNYYWLKKQPDESWSGEFGKRVKQNLLTCSHRKCSSVRDDQATASPMIIIQNNFVNLPAVTRIGMAGDALLCVDIPYPDEKTVIKLLEDPENAIPKFVYKHYFTSTQPSISAPDPTNTKLKLVQRDKNGNRWVDAPLDKTVDNIVYHTLDTLDDEFEAMKNPQFKDWKQREGLTAHIGFAKTEAYQTLQNDVTDVIKTHGVPYQ